jgi:hypothetical protein
MANYGSRSSECVRPGIRACNGRRGSASCHGTCACDSPSFPMFSSSPASSPRLFAQVSFDVDQRVVLARFQSLILVVHTIYGHVHATQQTGCYGDSIGFQFYATTSLEADVVAQPRVSITVNAEKNEMELSRTVRCPRRRHSPPDCDRFESQRLTR